MFTPQEIQEKTFEKAIFGGYDMQTVDEFLEPLTEDYITLYKENAVLKSKMKVLVEKLEEYRSQEESMRKAMLSAQRTADAMVAEAERKCSKLLNEAQTNAQTKTMDADQIVLEEQERINCARQTAQNFIELVEQDIKGHLELLNKLKTRDMKLDIKQPVQRQKPFDFEDEEQPLVVPKTETKAEPTPSTEEIANEIEQNISRIMDIAEPVPQQTPKTSHADSNTIKFTNLQFGKNYDPTH